MDELDDDTRRRLTELRRELYDSYISCPESLIHLSACIYVGNRFHSVFADTPDVNDKSIEQLSAEISELNKTVMDFWKSIGGGDGLALHPQIWSSPSDPFRTNLGAMEDGYLYFPEKRCPPHVFSESFMFCYFSNSESDKFLDRFLEQSEVAQALLWQFLPDPSLDGWLEYVIEDEESRYFWWPTACLLHYWLNPSPHLFDAVQSTIVVDPGLGDLVSPKHVTTGFDMENPLQSFGTLTEWARRERKLWPSAYTISFSRDIRICSISVIDSILRDIPPSNPSDPIPNWDPVTRILSYENSTCREYSREAHTQFQVFNKFHSANWQTPISMIGLSKEGVSTVVKDINKGLHRNSPIRFRSNGVRITWVREDRQQTPSLQES